MANANRFQVFESLESNVRSYCRHFPELFVTACGAWLTGITGRKYLDFLCGAGSLNYGHNDPVIIKDVLDYIMSNGIIQSLDLHTDAKERFLITFQNLILEPRGLKYKFQFPNTSGANAVEAAIKLARKVTHRTEIAAFKHAYHGMSLGALAVTASPIARAAAGIPLTSAVFWPYDGDHEIADTLGYIENYLSNCSTSRLPAAAILETVQGEGGLFTATVGWLEELTKICKRFDVLIIIDDIQAGCGRTGTFFSFEASDLRPDFIVLSKSLSGFGTPFSLLLIRPELDIWNSGEHSGTFRGNNLGFVGATAALNAYWATTELEDAMRARATRVQDALLTIEKRFPGGVRVRGRGLMQGLEFQDPSQALACSKELFRRGIIAETCGHSSQVLKLLPPLNIEDDDLNFGLTALSDVF